MSSWRILYIENNHYSQDIVRRLLEHRGDWVLLAPDGKTGMQMALHQRPDLILLDINLPDTSGFIVLRALKGNPLTKHIPVIALTSRSDMGDYETCLRAGFDGYIAKPVMRDKLYQGIDAVFGSKVQTRLLSDKS